MAEPKVRFRKDDGDIYPPIEPKLLNEFLTVNPDRNKDRKYDKTDVLSVSGDFGVVNQIEFQGRSFAGADVKDYHILYHGDVVYTKSPLKENPFGIVKFNDGPTGIVSTLYAVYHCKDNVDGRIIEYYFDLKSRLNNYLKPLVNIGAKHDMKISAEKAISDYIMIPCLEEQQKIADFLSSVDEVITTSEEEVTNLETQKKAVMKKIFSQEVRFRRTDGSDFPEWEDKAIREFAQCVAGATPSTKVEEYWQDGTIPWMSSGEVNKGIIFDTDAKITQLGYDNTSTKMVPAETVVIALAGQGKTRGMVALTKIELCTNQSLCSIITDGSVYSAYLYQYLITQYQNLRKVSSGDGTRGGLNLQLVGDYMVLIPCFEEQQLIADFLSDFDEAISSAKKELELWKELKKGLLQQMFV